MLISSRDGSLQRKAEGTVAARGVHLYTAAVDWDPRKAASNVRKHGIGFAEAVPVLEDERAVTLREDAPGGERWVTMGIGGVMTFESSKRARRLGQNGSIWRIQ